MLKFVDMAFGWLKCILKAPYIPLTKEKGNHVYSFTSERDLRSYLYYDV